MTQRADHILLVGMMGSGKTTIGRRLAEALHRPHFDSDAQVELVTGQTVKQIFAERGEAAFRAEEKKALLEACALARPVVISVAGGAVLDPENRELIARSGRAVYLSASVKTLARRVGDGTDRPLLGGSDVTASIERLLDERRPLYEEVAEISVDVDGLTPAQSVNRVKEALRERIVVPLGERAYEVLVGPGTTELLGSLLPSSARRAAIVTQDGYDIDIDCPIASTTYRIGDGEAAKSLATIESLCRQFARDDLTRNDVIIGVGGGVVTDVAGFAASCYHRGTPVVHVATTLLGQIDAAIGGKTGVNLPEGKNLVGAFYQPSGVICDTDHLWSLPEREWRSGFGEMAKYAFLGVDDLEVLPLTLAVARCVALKAEVVASDERESGRRALLNYGHTLAHALEAAGFSSEDAATGTDRLRHGEAVGIGLVFASQLAERLGRIDKARVDRHVEVVASYGLSTQIPSGADPEVLVGFMAHDKKATGGLTFVLDGKDGIEVVAGVDRDVVSDTLVHGLGAHG